MSGTVTYDVEAQLASLRRKRDDEAMASAVHHALVCDMAVPDRTIFASVSGGVVLLGGTVGCRGERDEAERVVASVPGVVDVCNAIAVWPTDVESELVREMTREMLDAKREHEPGRST